MNSLAIIEYTIAFVLSISLLGVFPWYKRKSTDKLPAICLLLSVFWLIVDATLYVLLDHPEVPFIFHYLVNFISYTLGPAIFVIFISYREQYISERTQIKKWEYHVPMGLLVILTLIIMIEFFRGKIVVFENGHVVTDYGLPLFIAIPWLLILLYLPFVALSKRKAIGMQATLLLGFVDFFLLFAAIASIIMDIDLTVVFGAIEMFFTVTLLQRNQLEKAYLDISTQMEAEQKQRKLIEEQQALSDGLAREYHTVWLIDGFGEHRLHLFRSTGKKTVQRAVQRGLDEPTYDGTMVKYVMDSVHEDDRERVLEASKFETVERETPDVGTYVVSYKRYCDDEGNVDYHQMCFAKAVAENGTVNYILAFRDADKMLREQIAQQQQLEDARRAAEDSNKAKTNFLFNMSHDIRTPMNAITGFTNMAIRHIDEKDKVLDYLSKVQQSGNILLSLINNVLEVRLNLEQ